MTSSTKPQMTDHQQVPHVFTQYNGEQDKLTFSDQEFDRRLSRVRELLSSHNLDAFVLTSMHNIKYYSDFVPSPFGRIFAVVITPESSTTVTPWVDGGMPWRTTYGDNIVYSDWEARNFFRAVDQVFESQSIKPSRIGVEFDGLTVEEYRRFQGWFENAELVDMAEPIMRQRLLKSEEEVYLIRQGARIADIGGRAIKNAIREGITEYELSLIGTEAMVPEIAKVYPSKELRETWSLVQSGINTDGAHNWPTTRQLQKGDLLSINCFPMMSGHYTAMERTMTLGQPDQRTLDLWKLNVEAYELGLELIKPGAIAQDVAATINRFFETLDLVFKQRNGRPTDMSTDWADFQHLLAEAGLEPMRVHDLRHTAATMLLVQRIDPRVVMDIMGWSQTAMLTRYQHVLTELQTEAVTKVANAITPTTTPDPTDSNVIGLHQWRKQRHG